MQPVELGVRRKISLDPSISTTAHPYPPLNNTFEWERVLKIGNDVWYGEETGLWEEPGSGFYPCRGTIYDYYPYTEMRRVILNEEGEETFVEGIDGDITETTQSNIMVRCPKVFFKDEYTIEEEGVWGYEYHWMCKYKADNAYYVDPFHVRYDGEVFNGYCYIGSWPSYCVGTTSKPYSYRNNSEQRYYYRLTDQRTIYSNKNTGTTSGVDWQMLNINAFNYIKKIALILTTCSHTANNSGFTGEYCSSMDANITQALNIQRNDFGIIKGRYINNGYGPFTLLNLRWNTNTAANNNDARFLILGTIVYNNEMYYNKNYHTNYTTTASDLSSNWTKAPYFTFVNDNNNYIRTLNQDSNDSWIEYPSEIINTYSNVAPYYVNRPQGFWNGYQSRSRISTSSNTLYYRVNRCWLDSFDYFYHDKLLSDDCSTVPLCYPSSLNGTGTPSTNEDVLIESSSPAYGSTIETTDTITYVFNNDSVKPAIYDLSNKNMLVGRFADGQFIFGSEYDGSVTWTASNKQISIYRKKGWLTGSCNLWFQAADDQSD